jgi:hypothetical protein
LLINTLEDPYRTHDPSGDTIIAELAPFSIEVLDKHVAALKTLVADLDLPEAHLKPYLAEAIREITSSICAKASPEALLKILKWGINPKQVKAGEIAVESHQNILELLAQGLYGRLNEEVLKLAQVTPQDFDDLVEILSRFPSLQKEVAYMQAVSKQMIAQPQTQAIKDVKENVLVGKE